MSIDSPLVPLSFTQKLVLQVMILCSGALNYFIGET